MIFVWFIYGLAFFTLGLVILVYPKKESRFRLARHIWLVGLFGIIHGANEWLDMFHAIGSPFPVSVVAWLRMFTLSGSFLCLVQFGVTTVSKDTGRRRLVRLLPLVLAVAWVLVLVTSGSQDRLLMGDIWGRYLLCIPGAFLTALGLFWQTAEFQSMRLPSVTRSLTVAAATFLVYGVLAGVFVKEADFFPASVFNYRVFTAWAGFPIQVLRAVCAVVAAGSIIRMLDVFRWETQENLRISELRCATIASAMPVFLFMTDRDLVVTFMKGKGLEILGLRPEQARGRPMAEVFPSNGDFLENCGRALSGHASVAAVSFDGVPFEVYCSALRDPAGAVTHMVGVAVDISAQVMAHEQLNEHRRQMEKRAREAEIGVLSTTIGRQIAEPLSVAQLTLEKLMGDLTEISTVPEAVRHTVSRGLSEIARAAETLDRFLTIAHPDPNSTAHPVGLYPIAKRTVSVFAESAQRKGVTIAIKDIDFMPIMAVSQREMEQIFYQLIQWAVDTPGDGAERRLVITCRVSDDGYIELVFSGTGGGEKLPQPESLGLPNSERIDAMGLGLAVVRQIVTTHGGQITVDAPPSGGVIFRVRLPVTRVY